MLTEKKDRTIRTALKRMGWTVFVFNEENWNDKGLRGRELEKLFELL